MRLLRGLGSQLLPCGCLAGIYETYAATTVGIIDARGEHCTMAAHRPGETIRHNFTDGSPMAMSSGYGPISSGGPRLMR